MAIIVIIPVVALVYGTINGNIGEISTAMLDKAGEAVTLCLSLCGIMCFWCGLMRVAEKGGIVEAIAKVMSPMIGLLFKGVSPRGKAARLIAMNLTANIMGLGNASTPLGIGAMKALAEEDHAAECASDNMITLAVLNTASLQIIPTTAAALRAAQGAAQPMEILPCVWIVSVYAAGIALISCKVMAALCRWRAKRTMQRR